MSTSIGEIQLDLEIKSDIDEDVQKTTSKLAKQIRESMKNYSDDLFKELRKGLENSLNSVQETIENCLNNTKSQLQKFVEEMRAIAKSARFDIPVTNYDTSQKSNTSITQRASSSRGPPIKMSKIDLSGNKKIMKAQIENITNQMNTLGESIKNDEKLMQGLQKQYERYLAKAREKNLMEESLNRAEEKVISLTNKMDELKTKLNEVSNPSQQMAIIDKLRELEKEAETANSRAMELSDTLAKLDSTDFSSKAAKIQQQMLKLQGSMSSKNLKMAGYQESLSQLQSSVSIVRNAFSKLGSTAKSALSGISSMAKKAVTGGMNLMGNGFKNIGSKLKDFISNTRRGRTANDGFGGSFKRLFKAMSIYALAFYAIRSAMRKLASYMYDTLKTNNEFSNSLNQIKSNLQTAFTPIYEAILPAINALMSALAKVTAYISSFISSLFGRSLSEVKNATVNINSARDALDATTSSAKEAKRALAGFDEINNLGSSDSGTSSGSGSSYTPSDIDTSSISEFAKKLRQLWQTGDFSGIGKLIGEKVNSAVLSFTNFINWDSIGAKITGVVDSFTSMFNSLVATIDWNAVGEMLGTGINTISNTLYRLINGIDWGNLGKAFADGITGIVNSVNWDTLGTTVGSYFQAIIDGIYSFVTNADWAGIGKAFGDGVMGLVDRIDWAQAGKTVSNGIRGLFKTAQTAIANIDWKQLGNDVWTFVSNIDWGGIVSDLAYMLGQSIAGIGQFLWGFIQEAVDSIGDYWSSCFEDAGGNIVLGLFNGILGIFSGIGNWIEENIVDPFVQGFCDLFGINSPSTVMADLGKYLMEGLINGIKSIPIIGTVVSVVSDGINWIGEQVGNFKEKGSELFESLKQGIAENPIVQTVSNTVSDGIEWIGTKFGDIKEKGVSLIDNLKSGISGNSIVSATTGVVTAGISAINTKNGEFTSSGRTMTDSIKSGMSANRGKVTNEASSIANSIASTIKTNATNKASGWGSDMISGLARGITNAKSLVTGAVSGIAGAISSFLHFSRPDLGPLREYEKWMPDMMSGLTETLEKSSPQLLNTVRSVADEIADSLQAIQNPEIAFAGNRDITVSHVLDSGEESLNDLIERLQKESDSRSNSLIQMIVDVLYEIKESVDSKELNVDEDALNGSNRRQDRLRSLRTGKG